MNKFAERLKSLRLEKGLTLEQLAKEINMSYAAISRWEAKQRIPNIEALIVIAKYFNVSADYLLGLTDF